MNYALYHCARLVGADIIRPQNKQCWRILFALKKTMNDLPKRKKIRLKDYDYSQNGYYFITVCTQNKKSLFWLSDKPENIPPELSDYGKIVDSAINAIPVHYENVKIDKYVIMPDHIHLILVIENGYKSGRIISAPTVMTVIGQMKRWVSRKAGFSFWQKSFYEHVIRDEEDYKTKAEYILNNPLKRLYGNA